MYMVNNIQSLHKFLKGINYNNYFEADKILAYMIYKNKVVRNYNLNMVKYKFYKVY